MQCPSTDKTIQFQTFILLAPSWHIPCSTQGYTVNQRETEETIMGLQTNATGEQRIADRGGMSLDQIQQRICEIVFDQLMASGSEKIVCIDNITPDACLMQDLGADSLDVVEIITSVEEEFDLVMPDDVLEQLNTVRDAVEYLASRA
jgi:acyl carrier protein